MALRVLLADDAALWREGVAQILDAAGMDVVAQVGDAEALTVAADELRPDVAVVDVRMPPTGTDDGLRAAIWMRRNLPEITVLVLCQSVHSGSLLELLRPGEAGVGYLLKERVAGARELVDAVRAVAAGGALVDPLVAERLFARRGGPGDPLDGLTGREREVLTLIAEGRSNAAIAQQLGFTAKTMEYHVRQIFLKLGLGAQVETHNRVTAVLTYLRAADGP